MKKNLFNIMIVAFWLLLAVSCSDETVNSNSSLPENSNPIPTTTSQTPAKNINYLALGDSYTIGQSVCVKRADFPSNYKKTWGFKPKKYLHFKNYCNNGMDNYELNFGNKCAKFDSKL